MKSRKARIFLVVISLFLWAHLVPAVLAMPWLYPEKSQLEEMFSFSTELYGFQIGYGKNVVQFEEDLIIQLLVWWVISSVLFVLWLYSCWKIVIDAKSWPIWVFSLSGFVCLIDIPPLIQIVFSHSTLGEHFGWLIGYISERLSTTDHILKAYSVLMNIYLIPILYLGLFIYATIELFYRFSNRAKAA